jgi:cytochrome c
MSFIGLKKPEDRAAIIAWLRTLEDSPPPMPSQGEIDAEAAELAPPATAPAAAAPVEGAAPAEAPAH